MMPPPPHIEAESRRLYRQGRNLHITSRVCSWVGKIFLIGPILVVSLTALLYLANKLTASFGEHSLPNLNPLWSDLLAVTITVMFTIAGVALLIISREWRNRSSLAFQQSSLMLSQQPYASTSGYDTFAALESR